MGNLSKQTIALEIYLLVVPNIKKMLLSSSKIGYAENNITIADSFRNNL